MLCPLAWCLGGHLVHLGLVLGGFPSAFFSEALSVQRKHQKAWLLMRPQVLQRFMFSDFEHHGSHLALLLFLQLTEM